MQQLVECCENCQYCVWDRLSAASCLDCSSVDFPTTQTGHHKWKSTCCSMLLRRWRVVPCRDPCRSWPHDAAPHRYQSTRKSEQPLMYPSVFESLPLASLSKVLFCQTFVYNGLLFNVLRKFNCIELPGHTKILQQRIEKKGIKMRMHSSRQSHCLN